MATQETRPPAKPTVRTESSVSHETPRRFLPLVVVLVVVAAGLGIFAWYRAADRPPDESRLTLQGNIDVRQVNLSFKVDGRIESLLVDEGDVVKAGQVIATLDQRYTHDDLEAARARRDNAAAALARLEHGSRPEEIDEARAQVAEQQATLVRARQDYDRAERLVGQGAVSREDFDRAKAAQDQAKAQVEYAEKALRLAEIGPRQEDIDGGRAQLAGEAAAVLQAERRVEDCELLTPSDGVILTRAREKGAIISSGETIFTLTLNSPVWVRTYVNERDLGRIAPGMKAEVRTDTAPGDIYHGQIGFISPVAEFTPKTVETRELRTDLVYRLRVLVDNPDNGLRQGMPVTVVLLLDKGNEAVALEPLARVDDVTKWFIKGRPPAIDHLNIRIEPGQVTGVVGPDGAGKTTLMRLLAALLLPSEGSVIVCGSDTTGDLAALREDVSYMPQRFGLYEDLTVLENLDLYANLRGVIGRPRQQAFERLLAFTNLAPFTGRLAGQLSGGMKQKLGLACSLIHTPRLLLLDEPSVGVDPISRRELWQLVYELVDQGIGVVWSTAYLDEAERCASVLLLNEGRPLYDGPPKELTQRVAGRTFLIQNLGPQRRRVLAKALNQRDVIDGVIQGSNVRLVMAREGEHPDANTFGQGATVVPTPPRFEDAFVDLLGGGHKGESPFSKAPPIKRAADEAVVEAHELTRRFGSFTAADRISFTITRGEVYGLLGPNGAGKSTTFRMTCGLLRPTSGYARVAGYDLYRAGGAARQQLGYMAQKFSLYGDLSVRQNLNFFGGVYGLSRHRLAEATSRMVEVFGLAPYLDHNAGEMPLGFKQRLALACAIIHDPAVIFLDEPTSGVDPLTRREFWSHINAMAERGVTVMVTTHFLDEAEYCDRIGLVFQGRVIAEGSPDDLKASIRCPDRPEPTLEDAFIELVESHNQSHKQRREAS